MQEQDKQVWIIHMSELRNNDKLHDKVNSGKVAIGWSEVNLPELHDRDAIKDALRDIGMPENSNRMNAGQLFRFAEVAKEGELVALPVSGDSIVKIGRFSDNTLERDDDFDEKYVHVRRVEWIKEVQRDEFSQQSRNTLGSFTTFCRGGVHLFEEVETLLAGKVVAKRSINEDRTDIPEHEMEFAFEKYLENFIVNNWDKIDFGEDLSIYEDESGQIGNQYATSDAGTIDILAQDAENNFVVIELKQGKKSDAVVGQVLRYMGWVRNNLAKDKQEVRGLIIVGEKDQKLEYAVKEVSEKVSLKTYSITFDLQS